MKEPSLIKINGFSVQNAHLLPSRYQRADGVFYIPNWVFYEEGRGSHYPLLSLL